MRNYGASGKRPEHKALLLEANDFGQFSDDFNQPLAHPIRAAIRKLCEDLWQEPLGTAGDFTRIAELERAVREYDQLVGAIGLERDALRDMLADARQQLDALREALGVADEPHQSLFERMLEAAR